MPDRFALQARYVFPVSRLPIAGGCVTIEGQRIVAVGAPPPDCPIRDLGNVAIVPGLVNAHTHLEFSDLSAPLGEPGMPLVDWIRLLLAHRRAASDPTASVLHGLTESLRYGVTAIGDIATHDWRPALASAGPLPQLVVFHESIAPAEDRFDAAYASATEFLAADRGTLPIRAALSPHAPYSIHRRLLVLLVERARQFGVPLAMHLAESREELELLRTGGGPFRALLQDLGSWDPDPAARWATVLEYLDALAQAPRALVIHGNYLADAELGFLAERARSMSVVYCPRTHAYFRHEPYPLARMLEHGISVALGTDSRASNPDLSLLDEMRFVAEHHWRVPAAQVLELGTLAGAHALGLADQIGSLDPGKLANLAVIALGESDGDPHELLWAPAARLLQTWTGGQLAVDAH